jgi:hypothetical protein
MNQDANITLAAVSLPANFSQKIAQGRRGRLWLLQHRHMTGILDHSQRSRPDRGSHRFGLFQWNDLIFVPREDQYGNVELGQQRA